VRSAKMLASKPPKVHLQSSESSSICLRLCTIWNAENLKIFSVKILSVPLYDTLGR
jgi:hypothetical protein